MMLLFSRIYQRVRGRSLPEDLDVATLGPYLAVLAVRVIRGQLLGIGYKNCGRGHMRGSNVKVYGLRKLSVGRFVSFADGAHVDANCRDGIRLADGVSIGRGAQILGCGVIAEPGIGVQIGERSAVGAYNVVWGQGSVRIGRNCLLGPHVTLVSENHRFDDASRPIRDQGYVRGEIVIEEDCWIGAGVTVCAGVTIGRGSVVGAGAVVTRSLPAMSIATGVPARSVGTRGDEP